MEATRERIWHRGGEWRQRRGGKGGEADGAEAAERRKEVGMPGVRARCYKRQMERWRQALMVCGLDGGMGGGLWVEG